jgi:hypothetical protein
LLKFRRFGPEQKRIDFLDPMGRFSGVIPQLDPYREANNLERVRRVVAGRSEIAQVGEVTEGLSIIVLNKDRPDLLRSLWANFRVLCDLADADGIAIELLVGDTGSTDPEAIELLESPPHCCHVTRGMKYQFSRCNNELFERARYSVSLFMNNDVLFDANPNGILECYRKLNSDSAIGVIGAVLYFADGTIQHAGIDFLRDSATSGLPFHPGARSEIPFPDGIFRPIAAVTGAFMMVPSDLYSAVGGFDEGYAKECQDIDLCLKITRGGRRIEVGSIGHIVHLENATRVIGEEDWIDRALFLRRWSLYVEGL